MQKTCNRCGKVKPLDDFEARRSTCRACKREQHRAAEARRVAAAPPRKCLACHKLFQTTAKPRADGYKRGSYCSPACRAAGERATRVYGNCPVCEKEFWRWPSDGRIYCSKTCYSKACEDVAVVNCRQCNKAIEKKPCDVKRTNHQFCGVACVRAFRVGHNHPAFLHGKTRYPRGSTWSASRKKALNRDEYTCQRCGAHKDALTKRQWRLEVHHIIPFAFFMSADLANALPNLITYCHSCHWVVERKTKPQRKKRQMVLFAA